jgi:hypothetical protein
MGVQTTPSDMLSPDQAFRVIRASPPAPPQPPEVQLNFEIFEEIDGHCAYDPVAFRCFFTRLSNCVLGLHNWDEICSVSNVMNRGSILTQAADNSVHCCAIEELEGHQVDDQDGVDREQPTEGDESCEALPSKPPGFPRHRRKAVVPLDTSILCSSARLEKINQGFNPNDVVHGTTTSSSTVPVAKGKEPKNKGKAMVLDGPAYMGHSVPGAPPAPHLSLGNIQSIGVCYCKMQAMKISTTKVSSSALECLILIKFLSCSLCHLWCQLQYQCLVN